MSVSVCVCGWFGRAGAEVMSCYDTGNGVAGSATVAKLRTTTTKAAAAEQQQPNNNKHGSGFEGALTFGELAKKPANRPTGQPAGH